MANTKQCEKRIITNAKSRGRNRHDRSMMRTIVKRVHEAIASGSENIAEVLKKAQSCLDHMAQKGVIHKNKAARNVARLTAAVKKASN